MEPQFLVCLEITICQGYGDDNGKCYCDDDIILYDYGKACHNVAEVIRGDDGCIDGNVGIDDHTVDNGADGCGDDSDDGDGDAMMILLCKTDDIVVMVTTVLLAEMTFIVIPNDNGRGNTHDVRGGDNRHGDTGDSGHSVGT
jgi:hypothetical protein